MKLELALLAGAETKTFLVDLAKLVERMEKAAGLIVVPKTKTAGPVDEDEDTYSADTGTDFDADDDFAPAKTATKKKATAAFDDDETDTESEDDFDAAPPKKAPAKTKKFTEKDAHQACKEYAAINGVAETKALLKKKFKTMSVSEIPQEKYGELISLMQV